MSAVDKDPTADENPGVSCLFEPANLTADERSEWAEMLGISCGFAPANVCVRLERQGRATIERGVNFSGDMLLWPLVKRTVA